MRVLSLILLGLAHFASPDFGRAQTAPEPRENYTFIERPDFKIRVPRPNAPPKGGYDISADTQESNNGVYHLRGNVVVELHNATFKADEADFDENTGDFKANGHIYYRNYDQDEILYCDSAEYNTDTEKGVFHHVRGFTKTKVVARPGLLTTQEPFYFEGEYAEKLEDRYILHNGFITDCALPNPWWTLHGSSFDIIPDDRAVTRHATYRLRGLPTFFFPYFYKSLKKEPRKSGFLSPNIGNSNRRGFMFATGYYWAINRSMDATYIIQEFTARGLAHHIDFRGKPTQKSDFDVVFYGVQDRGVEQNGVLVKAPGYSIAGGGRTAFGNGWVARGSINFISSLAFRQQFTESFNEAIFSESHSSGTVEKNLGYYNFSVTASRSENFQDATPGNSVVIRKLPELELVGRERRIGHSRIPLFFSFDTSMGLYHRVQPKPEGQPLTNFWETSQFSSRADLQPTVTTVLRRGGLSLTPSFTMHETFYTQSFRSGTVVNSAFARNAPEFNAELILPSIERIFEKKTFLGDKLKHVIEPRASYKYVSNINHFADTLRFDTIDLLSNTSEVLAGITNRLYAKRGDSVNELLTWEVFQKYFFDPTFGGAVVPGRRNVTLSALELTGYSFLDGARHYSPVVSILRGAPRGGIGFTWETDYDPSLHRLVNSMFLADMRIKRYFVSVGSDQVRPNPVISPPANQFRSVFGYGDPNRKGINAAFSMVYDYRLARLQFGIAQATYNTNCCGISVQMRRFNFGTRDENVFLVSFSIANIGSVGNMKKQERLF
jgi:LPS-assembly protein